MSAAKTKAQGIIDDNAVGMSIPYLDLRLSALMIFSCSCIQQIVLPILQSNEDTLD